MKWIPLSERKPEINQRVLVYQKGGVHGGCEIDIEYLDESGDWSEQGVYCSISHWMPLPTFDETEKPMNELSVRYPCHAEKPKDPDWEKFNRIWNNLYSFDEERFKAMYEFLKAKYDK